MSGIDSLALCRLKFDTDLYQTIQAEQWSLAGMLQVSQPLALCVLGLMHADTTSYTTAIFLGPENEVFSRTCRGYQLTDIAGSYILSTSKK